MKNGRPKRKVGVPSQDRMGVTLESHHTPDAEERLRRAFELVLRAAARAEGEADTGATHGQEVVNDEH